MSSGPGREKSMEFCFSSLMFHRRNLNDGYNQSCRQRPRPIVHVHLHARQRFFCFFSENVRCGAALGGDLATCINAPFSSLFPGPFSFYGTHTSLVLRKIVSMGRAKARFSHIRCRFPSVLGLAVPLVLRAVPCPWAVIVQAYA